MDANADADVPNQGMSEAGPVTLNGIRLRANRNANPGLVDMRPKRTGAEAVGKTRKKRGDPKPLDRAQLEEVARRNLEDTALLAAQQTPGPFLDLSVISSNTNRRQSNKIQVLPVLSFRRRNIQEQEDEQGNNDPNGDNPEFRYDREGSEMPSDQEQPEEEEPPVREEAPAQKKKKTKNVIRQLFTEIENGINLEGDQLFTEVQGQVNMEVDNGEFNPMEVDDQAQSVISGRSKNSREREESVRTHVFELPVANRNNVLGP
jgi:hypothetical protein